VAPCSQGAPCASIKFAAQIAVTGDTIRVAGGTYGYVATVSGCDGITINNVVCVANKSIAIEGGYSVATWTLNPAANPTVIDGGNTYRGVFVPGGEATTHLTLTNFTIRNGRAQVHAGDPGVFGAGMLADLATLTLSNVVFLNNQAIGSNLTGAGGSAAGSGLAIRSSPGTSSLNNVRFEGNSSTGGQGTTRGGFGFGAVFTFQSAVNIVDTQLYSNSALGGASTGSGEAGFVRADGLGGGIGIEDASTVTLLRVTAMGNTAAGGAGTSFGGGAFGGAVFVEDSVATIADCRFQANAVTAGSQPSGGGGFAGGGGVMYFNSNGSIDRSLFLSNTATGGASSGGQAAGSAGGGGLYLWRANPGHTQSPIPVRSSVFADNLTQNGATGSNPGGGGGGLFVQGLTANLDHATFDRNRLGTGANAQVVGQAIAVIEAPAVSTSTLNLSYSVVSNHTTATAIVVSQTNTVNFTTGRFSGNTNDTNSNNNPLLPGTINGLASMLQVADPGYVSPGGLDYHLRPGSPLINAATGSTATLDMDAQPRADAVPDIGADELNSPRLFIAGSPATVPAALGPASWRDGGTCRSPGSRVSMILRHCASPLAAGGP
jgi:hypothetical protein